MRKSIVRTMLIGFGLAAVQPALAANTNCDLSWAGTGVSAAPTDSGHLVAVRGTDGIIRVNEWKNSTQSWLGWMVLPIQTGIISDPWVMYKNSGVNGGQGVFARKTDSIVQWLGTRTGNTWSFSRVAFYTGGFTFVNRIASANATTGTAPSVFYFATNSDGTLKYQTWNGSMLTGWQDMGISGVVGSPYALQASANTITLFVQLSNGFMKANVWNGSSWSGWLSMPQAQSSGDPAAGLTTVQNLYSLVGGSVNKSYWNVNAGQWTAWASQSFPGTKSMAAVQTASNQEMLYGIDANNNVWRATQTATGSLTGASLVNCNLAP